MASFRRDAIDADASVTADESAHAFALTELTACWNQAYEAMCRADLSQVTALLDLADQQLPMVGKADEDTPHEAQLRQRATTAYGRLQHAMRAGLEGIKTELGQSRRGQRVLRSYGSQEENLGGRLQKSV